MRKLCTLHEQLVRELVRSANCTRDCFFFYPVACFCEGSTPHFEFTRGGRNALQHARASSRLPTPPQVRCRKNGPKKHRLRARSAFSGRCVMPCPCARACFPPRKAGTSPGACEGRLIPLTRLPSSARQREQLHLAPPRGARRGARRIPRESCRRWSATRTTPRR